MSTIEEQVKAMEARRMAARAAESEVRRDSLLRDRVAADDAILAAEAKFGPTKVKVMECGNRIVVLTPLPLALVKKVRDTVLSRPQVELAEEQNYLIQGVAYPPRLEAVALFDANPLSIGPMALMVLQLSDIERKELEGN